MAVPYVVPHRIPCRSIVTGLSVHQDHGVLTWHGDAPWSLTDPWPETVPCLVAIPAAGESYAIAVQGSGQDDILALSPATAGMGEVIALFAAVKLRECGYRVEDARLALSLVPPMARPAVLDGYLPGFRDHALRTFLDVVPDPEGAYPAVMRWRP